ncbi:hypothetical protein [Desertivibrio insolitus]|uniref:hypothetical protein n=1 Tax=Herbiconiux sp. SYSU D00978 TaxID=2812562 RepID=UPI001A975A35|nr:hypothetical protein [Herbiconiux sp. SYSU D00978]
MAVLRSLRQGTKKFRLHPTRVDGEWSVVSDSSSGVLFQLTTFGSDERVSEPKPSQTIQLDADMARELIAALRATFGSLE